MLKDKLIYPRISIHRSKVNLPGMIQNLITAHINIKLSNLITLLCDKSKGENWFEYLTLVRDKPISDRIEDKKHYKVKDVDWKEILKTKILFILIVEIFPKFLLHVFIP
eukprot:UN21095